MIDIVVVQNMIAGGELDRDAERGIPIVEGIVFFLGHRL